MTTLKQELSKVALLSKRSKNLADYLNYLAGGRNDK